jgi:hypothetical protein
MNNELPYLSPRTLGLARLVELECVASLKIGGRGEK